MKKILLPIFGGVLLTTSLSLTTGQNANVVVKQQENQEVKEQEIFKSWYVSNSQSALTEGKIKELQLASQSWDDAVIDKILNQALEYKDNQLTINWDKVDTTKLPSQILENINIGLVNLNNAVNLGYIKINITNTSTVQLIYPNINNNSTNSDIVYFDSNTSTDNKLLSSTYSSYMWYTTYGPSAWWRFWEWGGIIHFSEQAVQNAKSINLIASLFDISSIFKNTKDISIAIDALKFAWSIGNSGEIDKALKLLASALGGADLEALGDIAEALIILSAAITFIQALLSASGVGALIVLFLNLVISIIVKVTKDMMAADRGNGVKWIWPNFIIPDRIIPE